MKMRTSQIDLRYVSERNETKFNGTKDDGKA